MRRVRFIRFGFCKHKLCLSKRVVTFIKNFTVHIFAHSIHCFDKMFGNMESIKHNFRFGQVFRQRVDIRGLHVYRGDRRALLLVHRSEISRKFSLCSSVHHCNQLGIVNVCHILVEFLKLCLTTLMRVGELFVQSASPWATACDILMSTSCHLLGLLPKM